MSLTDKFKDFFRLLEARQDVGPLDDLLLVAEKNLVAGSNLNAARCVATYLAVKSGLDIRIGYSRALLHAQEQALGGKGQERHGGVDNGDWVKVARIYGANFLFGQAYKKLLEAPRLPEDREERELYGVLVYIAFGVIRKSDSWDT